MAGWASRHGAVSPRDSSVDFPQSQFWDFSLSVYGEAGVAPACLRLQDQRGLDVNLLLFCGWLGVTGRGVLANPTWQELVQWNRAWTEEVIMPLREVRRRLKTQEDRLVKALRAKVGVCEIDGEHLAQLRMERVVVDTMPRDLSADEALRDVLGNLGRYLSAWGASLGGEDLRSLRVILQAVVPGASAGHIDGALKHIC